MCAAVAKRVDQDDVRFVCDGVELVIVHLTWNRQDDPRWPETTAVRDVKAFVEDHLKKDHVEFVECGA